MNKLFILALLLFSTASQSQHVSITNSSKPLILYVGIDNPISCVVEGVSCERIDLSADNAVIRKEGCDFIVRVSKPGQIKFIVSKKTGRQLEKIGEYLGEPRPFPSPEATVGGKRGDKISKGALKAQGGVGCYWQIPGFELSCNVTKFSVTIYRNNEIVFNYLNSGNAFDEKIRAGFASIQKGDRVVFSGITSKGADNITSELSPLEFTIDE